MTEPAGRHRAPLRRVVDALDLTARVLAAAGLVTMVVLIVTQVLFRYLVDQSLAWTEETSRYVFVLTSLLAITVAHRQAKHAGFTALAARLPVRFRRGVVVVGDLVAIAFFAVIGASSWALLAVGLDSVAPATGLPLVVVYAVFPLAAAVGVVFSVEHLVDHLGADPSTLMASPEDQIVREGQEAAQ